MTFPTRPALALAGSALMLLSACDEPLDFDLRGGKALNTSAAARTATANRPEPDSRGIISYPGYQVAVARRGDTVASVAARVGVDPNQLATFNGVQSGDILRQGEIIALPGRVAEPSGGPIQPPNSEITSIAGNALENAQTSEVQTTALAPPSQTGVEPIRHKVERGETAFTIARLYNVSIRSLADWNGLNSDFAVREGQFLLIPVAQQDGSPVPLAAATAPGEGTPTPTPPSATKPLPTEDTKPAARPEKSAAAPDLGESRTTASVKKSRMGFPVRGDIIREYQKGKNEGIDIAANPGSPVKAAASGVVAAITEDTNGIPIIVIKHPDNLLTVYSNVAGVAVKKGDQVARGQKLAEIRREGTAALHFEVRKGFDSVDPMPYLG
ncbi:peptidoglycan DD-metalloendopeptidase family protein [uncultured Roseovarius sp.]|uniref:peptidoglycan DD-metalloendopeptidase family protein n=1 Tax=uncultured Roseovarius sp. TaxID=293344 RepID=UPI0026023664|nr:peptidoglycan DD-metalloendopeptidase family protein [uncultured Roseovarius sp.]